MSKTLKLSLIIPVYNEEDHLKACLDAVAKQTVKPKEVIVVDNNSTDKSMEIASKYPFVKIIKEKRQSQVFAQATGYDYARGDIYGRIDADSVLPRDWVEKVLDFFKDNDEVVAVTGAAHPYDVIFKRLAQMIFNFYQLHMNRLMNGHNILWGANSAFRAEMWPKVKPELTFRRDIWEDYDMSYPLARLGRIKYIPDLPVGCSFQAAHKSFLEQAEYQYRVVRTYRLHHGPLRTTVFFVVRASMVFLFPIALLDTVLKKFKRHR